MWVGVLWLLYVLCALCISDVSPDTCVFVRIHDMFFFVCLSVNRVFFCPSMSSVPVLWVLMGVSCVFSLSITSMVCVRYVRVHVLSWRVPIIHVYLHVSMICARLLSRA